MNNVYEMNYYSMPKCVERELVIEAWMKAENMEQSHSQLELANPGYYTKKNTVHVFDSIPVINLRKQVAKALYSLAKYVEPYNVSVNNA